MPIWILSLQLKHVKKLGYTGHKFFEDDGAQCHAFWNKTEYVLAFRGTEPSELSDLLADLNAIPRGAMTHGLVHSGFRNECDKLWMDVLAEIEHNNQLKVKKDVYFTGHSLGAAMATISATRYKPEELFTFGSPRVGGAKFIKNITCKHYVREEWELVLMV